MRRGSERRKKRYHGRASLVVALTLLMSAGCHQKTPQKRSETEELNSIAREYVRLSVALGERDPDSLDFSIAPEDVKAEVHRSYPPLEEIDREASALSVRLHSARVSPEQRRRVNFLSVQLASIHARVRMLRGMVLSFDDEARVLFDTTRLPDTYAAERPEARTHVAALVPVRHETEGASPATRYAAYDRRFLVHPERLAAVMNAALASCRQHTLTYLRLPAGESVELTFVRNQPWSAFSRYRGHAHSTIQLNLDLPITVDDALELACHEGYPGHHVFNTLRDQALVQQRGWPEAQVQLTFSPQSFVSEAAAAYAPRLAFSTAERTQVERDVLFPLAGLPKSEAERYVTISTLVRELDSAEPAIAREYLDGRLEFIRAGQQLADQMLMAHPEASLLYLNEYRSYMLAYTDGPRRIAAYLDEGYAEDVAGTAGYAEKKRQARWKRYEGLMRDLHFVLR